MAELVDARDLKSIAPAENAQTSVKTQAEKPAVTGGNLAGLYNSQHGYFSPGDAAIKVWAHPAESFEIGTLGIVTAVTSGAIAKFW